ncbi:MAG: mechanosensitive ion channel [Gammaproteobacteria bacterium]|nr:mechanosensitive ion channel [Gammaproteobacteria bacterium]
MHQSIFLSTFLSTFVFLNVYCLPNNVRADETLSVVNEKYLENKIKEVDESKTLDEDFKLSLAESYKKTLGYLTLKKENEAQTELYHTIQITAPKKISDLEKELDNKTKKDKNTKKVPLDDATLLKLIKELSIVDLEQQQTTESIKQASITEKNTELSKALLTVSKSLPDIRESLIETNSVIEKKFSEKALISDKLSSEKKQATQWRIDTHIALLQSKIKKLEQQIKSQPIRLELLKIQKKLSDHQLKKVQLQSHVLQQKIHLKRRQDVKKIQALIQAEQIEAKDKHPLIQLLLQKNFELNEEINIMTKSLNLFEFHDEKLHKEIKTLQLKQDNIKKKLEIAGLNHILGKVLYAQKKSLPNPKQLQNNIVKRKNLMSDLGLSQLKYQEELVNVQDKALYIESLLIGISNDHQIELYDNLTLLVDTYQELLETAIKIDEKYLNVGGDINYSENLYLELINDYTLLLNKNLYWLRSAPIFNFDDLKKIPEQVNFFLSASEWQSVAKDFIKILNESYLTFFYIFLMLLFLLKRNHLIRLLINTGAKTQKISRDRLFYTFKAFFYTLLLAVPLPLLFLIISEQLTRLYDASDFTHAIALGLNFIVFPLFYLQFFRTICIKGGIGDIHFKWHTKIIVGLRRELLRLIVTFLPILFITVLLVSKGEFSMSDGLGRLFIIATIVTFAIFFYRLIKPKTGLLSYIAQEHPESFFAKFQTLLFITGLIIFFILSVLSIIGYIYTSAQLTLNLINSVWLIFGIVILQQISVRWLLITKRRYALNKAYEKRQEILRKKSMVDGVEQENPEDVIDFDETEIDMVSLSNDSSKLLNMVLLIFTVFILSIIWADVLPALLIFDQFVLWDHLTQVDGVEQIIPITLSNIIYAILILVLTLLSARDLPAVIEILLLQNSSMSIGSRYTITTLVNYTIIGVGFFIVFNLLGAEWAKLQWLFAALSVGIGFGLQEIVANFISGIIILFERPIRVGDYVTVGDNEGVVSKIRIRATTILTKDRKELLVPNKEFITTQLLNWSLSDPIARLIIPVGVAYGSDIPLARKILLDIALTNAYVLSDPPPRVVFFNFGDNTLDLQLRCFIGSIDYRFTVVNEINEMINEQFNAADINIAFPQRDVHLDINKPVEIVINQSKS